MSFGADCIVVRGHSPVGIHQNLLETIDAGNQGAVVVVDSSLAQGVIVAETLDQLFRSIQSGQIALAILLGTKALIGMALLVRYEIALDVALQNFFLESACYIRNRILIMRNMEQVSEFMVVRKNPENGHRHE